MRQRIRISLMLVLGLAVLSMPAYAQITQQMQERAVANGDGRPLATNIQSTATVTVDCSSCSGGTTINFEATQNGTDYVAITGALSGTTTTATSTTSATKQVWVFSVASFLNMRARVSLYSAGSVSVFGRATPQGGGGGASSGGGGSVQITDGNDTATVSAGGELNVSCGNCSGTGVSHIDDAAFTVTSDDVVPIAGVYQGTPDSVNDGDAGAVRMTIDRILLNQPMFANVAAVAGNGASGAGVQRVTLANDSTGVIATVAAVTAITSPVTVTQTVGSSLQTAAIIVTGSAQIGHLEANQSVNVAQINGVTPLVGNGASGTGATRVTIANDSTGILATVTNLSQLGTVAFPIEDAAETAAGTGIYAMSVRRDTAASSAGTTGDNATINTDAVGALWANIATPATIGIYVEDAAQTAGGNLMMAGSVRRDAAASSAGTDGDNATINTDALGRLWVNCGTGCSGGTQYNIDTVAGASDTGTLALAVRDDALTTLTPVDGDYVQLRTNSTGALWVQNSIIDAAEDAAVATNPVPIGGVYRTASVTLDNGDVGYPRIDVDANLQIVGTGTAGAAAGGILTIQGVASMTPILATVSDGAGALNVIIDSGTVTTVSTVTAVTTVSTVTTLSQLGGVALPIEDAAETAAGVGIYAMAVRRDTQASSSGTTGDNSTLNVDATGNLWISGTVIEDAAETAGGAMHLIASVRRDTPASSAGTTGDNATINTDASGNLWVTETPSITGGWSALNATAADGATACTSTVQAIKASQGTFGGYFINNPNTADSWLHIYNVASGSVTVGTTAPTLTYRIPGQAANSVGANVTIPGGVQFSTAMSLACTTTAAGNGNPTNALEADIYYK